MRGIGVIGVTFATGFVLFACKPSNRGDAAGGRAAQESPERQKVTANYALLDRIATAPMWSAEEMWRRRVLAEGFEWYDAKAGWECAEAVRVAKRRAGDEFAARDRAASASTERRKCFDALGSAAMPPVAVVDVPAGGVKYDFEKKAFVILLSAHAPATRRHVRYLPYGESEGVPGALVLSYALGIPDSVHFDGMLNQLWQDQTVSLWLAITERAQFFETLKSGDIYSETAFSSEPDAFLVVPWDEADAREFKKRLDNSLVVQFAFEPRAFDSLPVQYRGLQLRGVGGIAIGYRLATKLGPVTSWTAIRKGASGALEAPRVAAVAATSEPLEAAGQR